MYHTSRNSLKADIWITPKLYLNHMFTWPVFFPKDYDEADLIQCREALLRDCDQNHDGKIDYNELRMLLMSYNQVSIDNPGFEQEDSS